MLALLRQHKALLQKIKSKRKALAGLEDRVRQMSQTVASMQPLVDESQRLDVEVHALFAELLARPRQPRATRRVVAEIYATLEDMGVLSPRDLDQVFPDVTTEPATNDDEPFAHARTPPPGAGGFSARPPGSGPAAESLRDLFRRLAGALHPDKVQNETEKDRRTEIMKEVSRAYQDGDMARLLDLERTWMEADTFAKQGDDVDRRCATIARTNEALRTQLKELTQEVWELRHSPPMEMMRHFGRTTGERGLASLMAGAKEEIARLQGLRDFVVSFRDGKITLDEFIGGPQGTPGSEAPDDDDMDDTADAFLESLLGLATAMEPRRQQKKPRWSKGGRRPGDIPF